jgi:hypothetical protein
MSPVKLAGTEHGRMRYELPPRSAPVYRLLNRAERLARGETCRPTGGAAQGETPRVRVLPVEQGHLGKQRIVAIDLGRLDPA